MYCRSPPGELSVGKQARAFQKKFFPDTTAAEWNDWRWQMRNRIRTPGRARARLQALRRRARGGERHTARCRSASRPITRACMSRDDPDRSRCAARTSWSAASICARPARRTIRSARTTTRRCPGLVHRYPDRVLFLTTGFCSTYCRYCTRSRMVGKAGGEYASKYRNGSGRSPISRRTPRCATCCSRAAIR